MRLLIGFVLIVSSAYATYALLSSPSQAIAAEEESTASSSSVPVNVTQCTRAYQRSFDQQVRILRQTWFGRLRAEEELINAVRHDEDGNAWMKMSQNTWRTSAKGFENTTWTDHQIDLKTEWEGLNEKKSYGVRDHRQGYLTQKRMTTSQFIPDLVGADRAFKCRLAMVCEGLEQSINREKTEGGLLTIETPGCAPLVMKPITECRFGNADEKESIELKNPLAGFDTGALQTACQGLIPQLERREESFLRIAVAYDAAYRSLLQLGGSMDSLIRALRGDVLAPLEDLTGLFPEFSKLSCFSPQCHE